ncbi:protein of unknown function [Lactobacillus delbrueckii subsp. delbrueckii]|uniref:Uncharacterized protein n=1 Tax=Lactobacillus delbrueckii subsp. delbrueckii TaxID=83684 RepID=A0AAU9R0M3_9LACO|nr:protein of unknown function [Lactobacillus delbrueckii subsp. delbrueckii]
MTLYSYYSTFSAYVFMELELFSISSGSAPPDFQFSIPHE